MAGLTFRLRDWFWLVLVLAIVLSKYAHDPQHMECPCCGSVYPTDLVRSVMDY